MSQVIADDEMIHVLNLLKPYYGILVSDCSTTTGWAALYGTPVITTANVRAGPYPADDNYKEADSLVIDAAGAADSSGRFMITFTPTSAVNFQGTAAAEYVNGWLQFISFWVKINRAGTIRCVLSDGTNSSTWDRNLSQFDFLGRANGQGYIKLTLASPTSTSGTLDLTAITSISIGYINRTPSETGLDLKVDGLRVQGDPTFDLMYWATGPIDDELRDAGTNTDNVYQVTIEQPKSYPGRHRISGETADRASPIAIGSRPTTFAPRKLRIGYQIVGDPTISNRDKGSITKQRQYLWKELRRILLKYPDGKAAQGLNYIRAPVHIADDDFTTAVVRAKGYLLFQIDEWHNVNG